MSWLPTKDFVLVKLKESKDRSEGGLYLPEVGQTTAEVIAVNSEAEALFDVGDTVMFILGNTIHNQALPVAQALLHKDSVIAYLPAEAK